MPDAADEPYDEDDYAAGRRRVDEVIAARLLPHEEPQRTGVVAKR